MGKRERYLRAPSLTRTFLTAVGVLYLVMTVAAVFVFVRTVNSVAGEYVNRFSVSQNLLERNRILAIIDRDAALSLKMADDPVVHAWMRDEWNVAARAAAVEQLESYRRIFRDESYFVGVADGLSFYAATGETEGVERIQMDPDESSDRWFFETLESDRDFWINVDYNILLNDVLVWINCLVRDADGVALGAVGTGLDLSEFLDILVNRETSESTTIITNSEGAILAHPDRSIIEYNARVPRNEDRIDLYTLIDDETDRTAMAAAITNARESGAVGTVTVNADGAPVTAAVGYIPDLDWYNLVMVEKGQIIGVAAFYPLLQIMVVSLLAVLAVVFLLLNRLVLAPIGQLSHAARDVARGRYEIDLSGGRNDEIGAVATSFTTMAKKIRDYTANLEQMVEERTQELQATQGRIMESIRYGRLIQTSIMPSENEMQRSIAESFLINQPLDTVGGDFAFFRPMDDGFCIAVGDCTGHGVPGAFMTMLLSAILNRVIETSSAETGTAEMLQRVHRHVQDSMRGSEGTAHLDNGLDIALCRYFDAQREIEFSGAGLPLLYTERTSLVRVGGSRVRLGFRSTVRDPAIESVRIPVHDGSAFYLFSDGILDLPGGARGFGLGEGGFHRILNAVCTEPLADQREKVLIALNEYRGAYEPRDDMILLAFAPRRLKGDVR
jgi:phosphoserine phosphatase RsbU/P